MKRYVELVEVDDNGKKTVVSSEEQKFSPKKAVSDFAEKHPKVVKAAKVTGLVILAGGAALLGAAAVKGKNGSSQTTLLSDDDQKLLAENPESSTDTVPVDVTEEVSEEC